MKPSSFFFLLVFLFFFCLEATAENKGSGLNPFLTEEEREIFKDEGDYTTFAGLKLSAIFYQLGDSKAIIDGRVVKKGDIIAGKKVFEIMPEAVILDDSYHKFILRLNKIIPSIDLETEKQKDE